MASRETADITAEGLYMEIERITGSPTVPSH